jgi:sec-independent protein translocase protein TatB
MFDIAWSELIIIAVVALIAIGPKELPGVLRMVGQWMGKARRMAAEFQGQFNEAMREAEMADLKKTFDDVKDATAGLSSGNLLGSLQKDVNDAMTIEKFENIDPPVTPTTPEPPTPETFAEAEAHVAAVGEPLAIVEQAPMPERLGAPVDESNVVPLAGQPVDHTADLAKDAKAS